MDERPAWRNVLSILVTCILVIRLFFTCSNMNNRNSSGNTSDVINFQETEKITNEIIMQNNRIRKKTSNEALYGTYQSLDSLSPLMKESYGILRLERDTVVFIDLSTKIKIPKHFYYQNNHDDTLRMAFKSPENLNIFIHDFESKEEIAKNFKSLKSSSDLKKYKENEVSIFKIISYKISKNNKRFNGYALCFKTGDFQTFFEFESNNLSSDKLKEKAIDFLSENLKTVKK